MTVFNNTMLNITFPENKFEDFYVYDLNVTEEISELFEAKVTVLSDVSYSYETLIEALSLNVTLNISQTLEDGKTTRQRSLSGIVTSISHGGVFFSQDKKDCYSYQLTIEPELSKLKYVMRKTPYNRMNVLDVIMEALKSYNLEGFFSEEYISHKNYTKLCLFNQSHETDYDFLKRLLGMYGLSFVFCHEPARPKSLSKSSLYFSFGASYPVAAKVAYSDKRQEPAVSRFNFRTSLESQSLWSLDKLKLNKKIGVDGVVLQETYPNSNIGGTHWKVGLTEKEDRKVVFTNHFHAYVREIPKETVDTDVLEILTAQHRAFEIEKEIWQGEGNNLLLTPTRLIQVESFYAQRDKNILLLMLFQSKLYCRAKWPQSLSVSPQGQEQADSEEIKVTFKGMNYKTEGARRFCSKSIFIKK